MGEEGDEREQGGWQGFLFTYDRVVVLGIRL